MPNAINTTDVLAMDADQLDESLSSVEVPEHSGKFRRVQGEASVANSDQGRLFSVTGPKADRVRKLIFADLELTRREISELAQCSASRVGEVVWGLEYDKIEFPAIPKRRPKVEAEATDDEG